MSLENLFIQHIKQKQLFTPSDQLLIAVSGGVDSVVLCHLCKAAGFSFSVAHCNFQLRGEESERDEQFVKQLAKQYNAPLEIKKFDTEAYAKENKCSIQEAARDLRYAWFRELMEKEGDAKPTVLLTAHHKDDNIETLLMNFFRGTGLHGMTGIPERSGYIRRPLLPFDKEQLLQYAKDNKLSYVEDSSNASSKYTRNYFRNEWLPALEKIYPNVKENLASNIQRFSEIERLYQESINGIKKSLVKTRNGEAHIPWRQLMKFNNRALIYEIIHPYGFSEKQVEEVVKLAASESGKNILSPDNKYRIIKHRLWFIIAPVSGEAAENIIIDKGIDMISFAGGELCIKELTTATDIPSSKTIACIETRKLVYPLLLRKWKKGDYFYPLGMKKKKKLARFLIDQKLSATEKENCWVLESDQRILWVVGQRIDDRFKLTDKTRSFLRIEYSSYRNG